MRSGWVAAARARSVSAIPQPGLPPEDQHGVGMGPGDQVEGGDEGSHPFAGLEGADEGDQRAVDRYAQGAEDGAIRARRRARAG